MLRFILAGTVAVVFTAACGDAGSPATTSEPGTAQASAGMTEADLVEIIDGDSLRARVSGLEVEVRLLGINAPERDECFADLSAAALREAVGEGPIGLFADPVVDTDQFGRLLRYVFDGDGALVNRSLVRRGFALALAGDHARREAFRRSGDQAWQDRRGMWAPDACGQPSPALVVAAVDFDPPGPDEENLAAEHVAVTNPTAGAVDLTGWSLRDESSTNRYAFPGGTTLAPEATLRVRTGCGADDTDELYWCADGPVWNNDGDSALLLDPAGNVVDRFAYDG